MGISPVGTAGESSASGSQQTTLKALQKQEEQLRQQIAELQETNPDNPQIKVLQQRLSQLEAQILEKQEQQTQSSVNTGGGKAGPPPAAQPAAAGQGKVDIQA